MNAKRIVTFVLLLFVVGSVAAMFYSEMKSAPATMPAEKQAADSSQPAASEGRQLVAYYFHGNARCTTCMNMEAYADEALKTGFPGALDAGRLVWKVVNVEEPGNEHFIEDYQLATKSVILSDIVDGKETKWKNLDDIWSLSGEKEAFIAYIQKEAKTFLGEDNG
ncbi:MAG: nitrophenyl compound nitroreductase subunit ArsF family protein [Candidatus Omnitrophota bacterium]